jgi:restriction endonuclease S subunit
VSARDQPITKKTSKCAIVFDGTRQLYVVVMFYNYCNTIPLNFQLIPGLSKVFTGIGVVALALGPFTVVRGCSSN